MELNFNSVETIPNLNASAAFQVDSGKVFKEDVDMVPTIIDKSLSYMPWGGDWSTDIQEAVKCRANRMQKANLFALC